MEGRKYFFFDIDGTLTLPSGDGTSVPESTRRTVDALRERGHFVSIATGRSYAKAVDVMRSLGFENMVSDGGHGVTIDGELLGIDPLDRDLCIRLVRECEAKGFAWGIQPDNSDTRLVPDGRFMELTNDRYMRTRVVEGLDPEDYEQIFKVYVACRDGEEEPLETLDELPWCRFMEEYIFVEPADKARGIRRIVSHLGGDVANVVVFGDERNDLSMFCPEWTCVAMGNAVPELKERADYVTESVWDDGISKACEHFGWI